MSARPRDRNGVPGRTSAAVRPPAGGDPGRTDGGPSRPLHRPTSLGAGAFPLPVLSGTASGLVAGSAGANGGSSGGSRSFFVSVARSLSPPGSHELAAWRPCVDRGKVCHHQFLKRMEMRLTERHTEVSHSSLSLCLRTSLNPFICLSSPRGACVCFHVCVGRPRLAQSPHRRRRSGLPLSPRHPAHQEPGAFRLQKMLKQPPLTSPFFAGHRGMGGAGARLLGPGSVPVPCGGCGDTGPGGHAVRPLTPPRAGASQPAAARHVLSAGGRRAGLLTLSCPCGCLTLRCPCGRLSPLSAELFLLHIK